MKRYLRFLIVLLFVLLIASPTIIRATRADGDSDDASDSTISDASDSDASPSDSTDSASPSSTTDSASPSSTTDSASPSSTTDSASPSSTTDSASPSSTTDSATPDSDSSDSDSDSSDSGSEPAPVSSSASASSSESSDSDNDGPNQSHSSVIVKNKNKLINQEAPPPEMPRDSGEEESRKKALQEAKEKFEEKVKKHREETRKAEEQGKKKAQEESDKRKLKEEQEKREAREKEEREKKEKEEGEKKEREEKEKREAEQRQKEEKTKEETKKSEEKTKEQGQKQAQETQEKKQKEEQTKSEEKNKAETKKNEEKTKEQNKKNEENQKSRLQNHAPYYVDYGYGYESPGFRVSGHVCVLHGLFRINSYHNYVGFLPESCRPSLPLIFNSNYGHAIRRVDVRPTGHIYTYTGPQSGWLSLDGIAFVRTGVSQSYFTLHSGWQHYGYGWAPATVARYGHLCFVQGLIRGGNWHGWMGQLPDWCRPSARLIFSQNNHEGQARMDVLSNGLFQWIAGTANHHWLSLSGVVFPHGGAGNHNLPLWNNWHNYGYGYDGAHYSKAGRVCTVTGLIKWGHWNQHYIGQLPYWCRPSKRLIFNVNNHQYPSRVDIDAEGRLLWVGGGNNHGWLSLSGIKFYTSQ